MNDQGPQLPLFASSESSSRSDAPSSACSSAPTTSSSAKSASTKIDATTTTLTRPATARSSRDGADSASSSSGAATPTAGSEPQLTLRISTAPITEAKQLAIPRPRTLGECREEARPCPWVGCRHHLALEVAIPRTRANGRKRPTALRLNTTGSDRPNNGRRPGLASSAAAALVRTWVDEAVELLSRMRYTCTFDVVRDYPDGLKPWQVAIVLSVSEQRIDKETREAAATWRAHSPKDDDER